MQDLLLRTPLYAAHAREGGKMVPYAGYDMPVQYTSVIAESKAVREGVGMFDVSHMARLRFTGAKVLDFLEQITSNDVAKLDNGRGQYSLLPNKSGGCVDDIIVYRIGEHEYRMVVNAANHQKDVAWMKSENSFGVVIEDHTEPTAMIAVQGPRAVELLASLSEKPEALRAAPMFGIVDCHIAGVSCFAPRSGYTGEDGYELICHAENADTLWTALREAGVTPCGLASRDILRVEAGLPLYGHELNDEINPISVGLGWVIGKEKSFNSSDVFADARTHGTAQKLQGIRLESRRVADPGTTVWLGDRASGTVSSGVFSPLLNTGIAFAFLDSNVSLETAVEIEIRGKKEPGVVVNKRFFKRK